MLYNTIYSFYTISYIIYYMLYVTYMYIHIYANVGAEPVLADICLCLHGSVCQSWIDIDTEIDQ